MQTKYIVLGLSCLLMSTAWADAPAPTIAGGTCYYISMKGSGFGGVPAQYTAATTTTTIPYPSPCSVSSYTDKPSFWYAQGVSSVGYLRVENGQQVTINGTSTGLANKPGLWTD